MGEDLDPAVTVDAILALARGATPLPVEDFDEIIHNSSPRVRFVKSLPHGAKLLDLGAGDGAIANFRPWLKPKRDDLRLYAYSLDHAEGFASYDGYEIADFNQTKPDFGGVLFDAILASHFVEHIEGGAAAVMEWARSRIVDGGRLYLEFPSLFSKQAARRTDFAERGLDVSCVNFFDDASHLETLSLEQCRALAQQSGFFVEESGYWRNPFIEHELLRRGLANGDQFNATLGVWMKTYFSQYVVLAKL